MGRLFGTDGVRGVAMTELTCELAMNIGKALAFVLSKGSQQPYIVIGKDTRRSSDIIEAALVAGITAAGGRPELAGTVPTPAVAFFVKKYGADAGIMITASHNPPEFNGIKLFNSDGYKFPDEVEDKIEDVVKNADKIDVKVGNEVGIVTARKSALMDYVYDLCDIADRGLGGIKVLVDCANGCASVTAGEVLNNLGVDCTIIHNYPNGMNINENCGSTHIEELARQVVENQFDLGIAFDGDADRCLAVDEKGNVVDGDKLIALLSLYMKQKGRLPKSTAVVTVMSNLGFHQYMSGNGVATVCVPVGDRYVIEEMAAKGYGIGGEQSGHIIFSEHSTTGDGMLTSIKLLCMLKDRGVPLSALTAGIPVFPQILKNVTVAPDKKGTWETNPRITGAIERVKATAGQDSRILIRESGTEPLLRVMIEGKRQDEIVRWADEICAVVEKELS